MDARLGRVGFSLPDGIARSGTGLKLPWADDVAQAVQG